MELKINVNCIMFFTKCILYGFWLWANVVEEEIYDSALSRACLALFVRALFEGCIHFILHWSI